MKTETWASKRSFTLLSWVQPSTHQSPELMSNALMWWGWRDGQSSFCAPSVVRDDLSWKGRQDSQRVWSGIVCVCTIDPTSRMLHSALSGLQHHDLAKPVSMEQYLSHLGCVKKRWWVVISSPDEPATQKWSLYGCWQCSCTISRTKSSQGVVVFLPVWDVFLQIPDNIQRLVEWLKSNTECQANKCSVTESTRLTFKTVAPFDYVVMKWRYVYVF